MVDLKPAKQNHRQTQTVTRFGHRRYQLLWFILASVLIHSLVWLFLGLYQRSKPVTEEVDSKPIEFVVVPEEESAAPPPETEKRATENSIAEKNTESEATAPNNEIEDDTPVTSAPPPQPEPVAPTQPAPTPAPAEVKPEPEPAPTPAPELAEPPAAQQPLLSGSDANPITTPEPESSVATTLPPPEPTEAVPEPEVPQATNSSPEENSASSLLGGDYKKTLANGGADAFFSPEALAYQDVLDPGQLNALKDINLGPYFDEVKRRVKRNWNPSYGVEEYTTFLTFDIEKNGQITGLRVTQSSGSEQVDRESLAAVQNSAPFDPLPAEFPLEALEVKFSFNIYIY